MQKRKNKSILLTMAGLTAVMTAPLYANAGATEITTQIDLLVPVAVGVIGAAVLVVVVPWGAKMAIRAFKSICGS